MTVSARVGGGWRQKSRLRFKLKLLTASLFEWKEDVESSGEEEEGSALIQSKPEVSEHFVNGFALTGEMTVMDKAEISGAILTAVLQQYAENQETSKELLTNLLHAMRTKRDHLATNPVAPVTVAMLYGAAAPSISSQGRIVIDSVSKMKASLSRQIKELERTLGETPDKTADGTDYFRDVVNDFTSPALSKFSPHPAALVLAAAQRSLNRAKVNLASVNLRLKEYHLRPEDQHQYALEALTVLDFHRDTLKTALETLSTEDTTAVVKRLRESITQTLKEVQEARENSAELEKIKADCPKKFWKY